MTAARVIDGRGGPPLEPGGVLIDQGRVVTADTVVAAPDGAERLDFPGCTILPGLIDCHVHLSDAGLADATVTDADSVALRALRLAEHARRTLAAGVTAVRDVGGRDHLEFELRRAVAEGVATAPRLVLAGKIVAMTTAGASSWRGMYREADGPWEVVKAVREQVKAGADVIKVMATGAVLAPPHERPGAAHLTLEELRAAVETAHALGRRVAAHAHGAEGIRNAVAAGVDTIEHGTYLHEDERLIDEMARRGVFLVPTLKATALMAEPPEAGIPEGIVAKAREAAAHRDRTFRAALAGGVPIAMGTDAATPFNRHGENAQEIELMVRCGMTPAQAIVASTATAAQALGRDDIGTLAAGKLADLVVFEGDPLADVGVLTKAPRAVFLEGRRVA